MFFLSFILSSAFALSNAQPALDPYYDNVALIKATGLDESGQEAPGYCNGTFISANTMVTAAHCVAQTWLLNKKTVEISTGHYKYVTRPDGTTARVGYVYTLR